MERAKNVMAALLAEVRPEIKGFPLACILCHLRLNSWAIGKGATLMAKAGHARKTRNKPPASDTWEQIGTPHGGFREAEAAQGRFQLAPESIDNLKALGFTSDEIHRIVAPRRTLARRRDLRQNLTTSESDRVLRLERISEMADRVFGNHEKAKRWLRSEIIALNGARPIDLLETETGAREIEQELIRIDYGMLA
jgi:putative toxin-antitoxin system antitoxin component (TIGR02293 family)